MKSLIQKVKDKVVENPLVSTQQLYETERNKQVSDMTAKKEAPIIMPDYSTIRDRFIRKRGKLNNATNN